MFGYVRPSLESLGAEEQERFRQVYCGLCHTLGKRYGFAARFILNYDFTFLAVLLSDPSPCETECARCPVSPVKKRCYRKDDRALELAADESIILAYWQVQDGIADHGFFAGFKYRLIHLFLKRPYRKAARFRPEFSAVTQTRLQQLSALEAQNCESMDRPADLFAQLLAAAADLVPEKNRRRVLQQMLYHLGRWIYLIDAADDLKKDIQSGSYNPLRFRYHLQNGVMGDDVRKEFETTLDHSIHMIASAYELWDFGCWKPILENTIYYGLFQVGKAVLDGKFNPGFFGKKKNKTVEESA